MVVRSPNRAAGPLARAALGAAEVARESARIHAFLHQTVIDAEVRATRRELVDTVRRRGGAHVLSFLDSDFLALADTSTLYDAIIDAAITIGDAPGVDLQTFDATHDVLRMAGHRGLPSRFLEFFDTVRATHPTACALALGSRRPVAVDDVRLSPIFRGRPTLHAMLDARSNAVYSYPLLAPSGDVLGVLSFHHPQAADNQERERMVACCAAVALSSALGRPAATVTGGSVPSMLVAPPGRA